MKMNCVRYISFIEQFVSSLPTPKFNSTNSTPSSHDAQSRASNRRDSKYVLDKLCQFGELCFPFDRIHHHQQTLKEMKEVLRCVEVSQREFVDTIEVCSIDFHEILIRAFS